MQSLNCFTLITHQVSSLAQLLEWSSFHGDMSQFYTTCWPVKCVHFGDQAPNQAVQQCCELVTSQEILLVQCCFVVAKECTASHVGVAHCVYLGANWFLNFSSALVAKWKWVSPNCYIGIISPCYNCLNPVQLFFGQHNGLCRNQGVIDFSKSRRKDSANLGQCIYVGLGRGLKSSLRAMRKQNVVPFDCL